jgi:hypothetical protein
LEEDNSFSIYPNPTSGQFTVELSTDNAEIIVTDILGKQIIKTQTIHNTKNLQLEDNGIYFISITTKQGTITRKLIVNK